MYCILCKRYTKEGRAEYGGCGHYEPRKIYAESYKQGFRLYEYSGGLRARGIRRLFDKTVFDIKEKAIEYLWKRKNE